MPRIARKHIETKYIHIMAQGINKEYIFNERNEMEKYFSIIVENEKDSNIRIVAYCIMNNHAHFLINTEDINEVSKFMKKVNTKYAMYYNKKHNRYGYVFRNRYRSEEILTQRHLFTCINYIHNNPVKAGMCRRKCDYKYSSYNDYANKSNFITSQLIEECLNKNGISYDEILKETKDDCKFIEYEEIDDDMKEVQIKKIVDKYKKEKNVNIEEIRADKTMLKELCTVLYIDYNVKQNKIGEILGVNAVKVNRMLKAE